MRRQRGNRKLIELLKTEYCPPETLAGAESLAACREEDIRYDDHKRIEPGLQGLGPAEYRQRRNRPPPKVGSFSERVNNKDKSIFLGHILGRISPELMLSVFKKKYPKGIDNALFQQIFFGMPGCLDFWLR